MVVLVDAPGDGNSETLVEMVHDIDMETIELEHAPQYVSEALCVDSDLIVHALSSNLNTADLIDSESSSMLNVLDHIPGGPGVHQGGRLSRTDPKAPNLP